MNPEEMVTYLESETSFNFTTDPTTASGRCLVENNVKKAGVTYRYYTIWFFGNECDDYIDVLDALRCQDGVAVGNIVAAPLPRFDNKYFHEITFTVIE